MEKNNEDQSIYNKEKKSYEKGNLSKLNNISKDISGIITKNIFLSLPKLHKNKNKINKTFLKVLNLTIKNKRSRTIDSYQENKYKYDNSTQTIHNKPKRNIINITIIDKDKYYFPKNDKFSVIIKEPLLEKNKKYNKIKYNTTYKDRIPQNLKKLEPIKTESNKISEQNNSKTHNHNFFQKKPSVDYITPIYKTTKIFRLKEEPNLKILNVGDLMKKSFKKKNNICLLKDDNKCDENQGRINLKTYFMKRDKFFTEERAKELKGRNIFLNKTKIINSEEKEKKFIPLRNCHKVLEFYKNNKFDNCKKLIEQTLLDVKKERKFICDYFSNYKKVFDAYDDWNSPKNKDNLYNI